LGNGRSGGTLIRKLLGHSQGMLGGGCHIVQAHVSLILSVTELVIRHNSQVRVLPRNPDRQLQRIFNFGSHRRFFSASILRQ
jgi:hypothetical protein